jgi:ribonuclease P protein component
VLKKINRLNKKKDFDRVFRRGRSFYSQKIGLKACPNGLDVSRVGIVVSTKVAKKATQRNLIKRRLREIVRLKMDQIKKSYDLMMIARPGLADLKYQELKREVELVLKKLQILIP